MASKYAVAFLIRKVVFVNSGDDIQAELDAARQLTPEERDLARKIKVVLYDDPPADEDDFATIDFDWWKEEGLIT